MAFTLARRRQLKLRNEKIYDLHKHHDYSYTELARMYSISKQRIGQILSELGLDKNLTDVL